MRGESSEGILANKMFHAHCFHIETWNTYIRSGLSIQLRPGAIRNCTVADI
jgi:hypothetical protein